MTKLTTALIQLKLRWTDELPSPRDTSQSLNLAASADVC
jgi:hypothetical protein